MKHKESIVLFVCTLIVSACGLAYSQCESRVIGAIGTSGAAYGVAISPKQECVYVRTSQGIDIIKISNPCNPERVSSIAIATNQDSPVHPNIQVKDDYAYTTDGQSSLYVCNVKNPSAAEITHNFWVGTNNAGRLVLDPETRQEDGNAVQYIYVTVNTEVVSVKFRQELGILELIGADNVEERIVGIDISPNGNVCYLAQGSNGFRIFKEHNPAQPQPGQHVTNIGSARDVAVKFLNRKCAFVAAGNGLFAVDVGNEDTPIVVGTYMPTDHAPKPLQAICVSGDRAYAVCQETGDNEGSLRVIDVSAFTGDTEGEVSLNEDYRVAHIGGRPQDIEVSGSYAYLACGSAGLQVVWLNKGPNEAVAPVVIVPGVMCTELWNDPNSDGIADPGEERIWWNPAKIEQSWSLLGCDIDGHPNFPIRPGNIFDGEISNGDDKPQPNIYGKLIGVLRNNGYTTYTCPYDWRLDLRSEARRLKAIIDKALSESKTEKVDIVAHSMGGELTRAYLQDCSDSNKPNRVRNLIFLGTSQRGAPGAYHVMLTGDTSLLIPGYNFIPNPSTAKSLLENFPGLHQLLPTYPFLAGKNGSTQDLFSPEEVYCENSGSLPTGCRPGNCGLSRSALNFHKSLDLALLSSVRAIYITGANLPTPSRYSYYCGDYPIFPVQPTHQMYMHMVLDNQGDQPVPFESSTQWQSGQPYCAPRYYYVTDLPHYAYMGYDPTISPTNPGQYVNQIEDTQKLILLLLKGGTPCGPTLPSTVRTVAPTPSPPSNPQPIWPCSAGCP